MTWTAPAIERTAPDFIASERAMLDRFLDYQRLTLLHKCSGLTAEQLKQLSAPPSKLTLLGLVRHMSEVERVWFRRRFAGEPIGDIYDYASNDDAEFYDLADADPAAEFATFSTECELARRAVADRSLDDTFRHPRHETDVSLRWLYLHLIEEYARHNGHADILRERIDGATGV